jgi:hypothetical protein
MNQVPNMPEATALDVEPILWLHRDPGGYVGFVRKPDPAAPPRLDRHGKPYAWDNLAMIRVDDLRQTFPALIPYLTQDSYFTVHSFYRPQLWKNTLTGYPDVRRPEANALWLTACYADVDCGRPESDDPAARMDWLQALVRAEAAMETGVIPQASIMARSGRGVYLFWMLRDVKDPAKLPHAWPEAIEAYKRVNKALQARLHDQAQLPVDLQAFDVARVLRNPGTLHSKNGRRATYWLRGDRRGGFVYTLPELAEALDLPALDGDLPDQTRKLARPAQYRKVKNPGAAPLRSHGTLALNALRAQDLLTLCHARGGFLKRGMKYADRSTSPGRRFMLTLYANFLRGSGADPAAALDAVRSMAANMLPPWPDEPGDPTPQDLVAAEYATPRRRRWSNAKLCALLGVSADMARELDLKTIRPLDVATEADQARPLQGDVIQARREWLREYIHAHPNPGGGGRWTARKVRDALSAFSPYPWQNHETANQDLNAIGYMMTRSRGGRPRRTAHTSGGAVIVPAWLTSGTVGK